MVWASAKLGEQLLPQLEGLRGKLLIAAFVFLLSGLGSSQAWVLFGTVVAKVLGTGWRLRTFNFCMAMLLLGCAVWLMWGQQNA